MSKSIPRNHCSGERSIQSRDMSPSRHRRVAICYGQFFSVFAFTECSTVTREVLSEFPGSVSQLGQKGVLIFFWPMRLWFGSADRKIVSALRHAVPSRSAHHVRCATQSPFSRNGSGVAEAGRSNEDHWGSPGDPHLTF